MSAPAGNGPVSETQRISSPDGTGQEIVQEKAKHTRGPWAVYDQAEDEGADPEEVGCSIESTTDPTADWIAEKIYVRANARLIAAAPDLAIVASVAFRLLTPDQCATLNADEEAAFGRVEAIAKAEGR